jgi:hypothetical protein
MRRVKETGPEHCLVGAKFAIAGSGFVVTQSAKYPKPQHVKRYVLRYFSTKRNASRLLNDFPRKLRKFKISSYTIYQ